ncbi:hypothetical protein MKX03_011114 [Papaver bracteatum]|nr:hypothetical protein MKX03_011114 [Papaver bracteatum]
MASSSTFTSFTLCSLLFACLFHFSSAATGRKVDEYVQEKPAMPLQYHNGRLLSGQTSVNLIWYGIFTPAQTFYVYIFFNQFFTYRGVQTISTRLKQQLDTPATWDNLKYSLGRQIFDKNYSLGNFLNDEKIARLASSIGTVLSNNAINVVLTSADVAVDGFCSSRCGSRGSSSSASTKSQFAYIWVGISEIQCPEKCASPFGQFLQPISDVSAAEMSRVMNLASLLIQKLRP